MRQLHEIEHDLNTLEQEFRTAVRADLKTCDTTRHVAQVAESNTATWSGGASVKNMCEQIIRKEAQRVLRDMLNKEAFSSK